MNYDFSFIIKNDNYDLLLKTLDSIKNQKYDLSRVQVVVETTKLDTDELNTLKDIQLDMVIREINSYDLASMYNDALGVVKGELINFIRSGIIFKNRNILSKIISKKNKKIITCKIDYFDTDTNKSTTYQLSTNHSFDICLEFDQQINVCLDSYFIKRDIIKNEFDSKFGIECTVKFIIDLFKNNPCYSNLGNVTLVSYIPLEDNTSKNSIQYNEEWYTSSLKNWFEYLKDRKNISLWEQVIVYYLLYSKYNCNLDDRDKGILDTDGFNAFVELTAKVLNYVDDRIIVQRNDFGLQRVVYNFVVPRYLKSLFYNLKNKDVKKYIVDNKILATSNNALVPLIDVKKESVIIRAINYKKGVLYFDCETSVSDYLSENEFEIKVFYDKKKINIEKDNIYSLKKCFNHSFHKSYCFKFSLPINEVYDKLSFHLIYGNIDNIIKVKYSKAYARLTNSKRSYWNCDYFTLINRKQYISVIKRSKFNTFKLELLLCLSKLKNESNKIRVLKLILLRLLYYITRPYYKNKHIWITFDKLYKAGDNGEYFFHYCRERGKNIYYIIKKDSLDYKRLAKSERRHLLIFNSLKAKLFSLHAEAILDTHANILSYCGFEGMARNMISGLFNAEIICIAHGLTMQDIAQYQNRLYDNINLYCLASKYEVKNLSKEIYGYHNDQLKLVGMARFDGLKDKSQKTILITPTWRRNIVTSGVAHEKKKHNDNFRNSVYFKIYNGLINDKRLIECAKKHDYRIVYLLHPAMSGQLKDYDKNDYVDIIAATGDMNYEKILTESALMVTDYSGVQYDFAYMKKPIIYFHPDKLPPHYDVGIMNYETMGFGPIIKNENDVVKELCRNMENGCKNSKKYIDLCNDFFAYDDYNNCERILSIVEDYMSSLK